MKDYLIKVPKDMVISFKYMLNKLEIETQIVNFKRFSSFYFEASNENIQKIRDRFDNPDWIPSSDK